MTIVTNTKVNRASNSNMTIIFNDIDRIVFQSSSEPKLKPIKPSVIATTRSKKSVIITLWFNKVKKTFNINPTNMNPRISGK
jgi:hypothetical protein